MYKCKLCGEILYDENDCGVEVNGKRNYSYCKKCYNVENLDYNDRPSFRTSLSLVQDGSLADLSDGNSNITGDVIYFEL